MKKTVAILLVACLATTLWLLLDPDEEFWLQSVSFGCTYAAPQFDSVVYTRMHYQTGTYEVVLHPVKGGGVTILSAGEQTAMRGVSNGRDYFYMAVRGNSLAYCAGWTPDSTRRKEILAGTVVPSIPAFAPILTPDGTMILYSSPRGLSLTNIRTGEEELLDSIPARLGVRSRKSGPPWTIVRDLSLSPDRRQLLYVYEQEDYRSIRIHARNDAGATSIVREKKGVLMRPRWLADGSGITLVERGGDGWNVLQWKADTSRAHVLYSSPNFIETAELHPGGRELLLTLGDTPEFRGYFTGLHVYLLSLETGELRKLGP